MTKYSAPLSMRIKLINWARHISNLNPQEAVLELRDFPVKELYHFITKTPVNKYPEEISRKVPENVPESVPNSPPHSAATESVIGDTTEDSASESIAATEEPAKKKRKKSKKIPHQKVKQLLSKYAPIRKTDTTQTTFQTTAMGNLQTLQDTEKNEMIAKITLQIKKELAKVQVAEVDSVQTRFKIAENLTRLAECFTRKTKTGKSVVKPDFYKVLEAKFNIGKRSYYYYVKFYDFLQKYCRFQHSSLSFNQLRTTISSIEKWFSSEECLALLDTDSTSATFWMSIPLEYHTFDSVKDIDIAASVVSVSEVEDDVDDLSDDMDELDLTEEQKQFWAKSRAKNNALSLNQGGYLKLKEKIREEFFDDDVSGSDISETTPTTSKKNLKSKE